MLFKAIKHQVDKGPVDAVTRKAKYTLNDNRLLREDVEYKTLVRTSSVILGNIPMTFSKDSSPLLPVASWPPDAERVGAGWRSERDPTAAFQSAGL